MRTLPVLTEALDREFRSCAELMREMQVWMRDPGSIWSGSADCGSPRGKRRIVQWAMQLSSKTQVGKVSYGTEAGCSENGVPASYAPGDIAQAHGE